MGRRGQVNGIADRNWAHGDSPAHDPIGWKAQLAAIPPDTRTRQQKFMGDPRPERSALTKKDTDGKRTPFDPRQQNHG